jgi:hypothetical protein
MLCSLGCPNYLLKGLNEWCRPGAAGRNHRLMKKGTTKAFLHVL